MITFDLLKFNHWTILTRRCFQPQNILSKLLLFGFFQDFHRKTWNPIIPKHSMLVTIIVIRNDVISKYSLWTQKSSNQKSQILFKRMKINKKHKPEWNNRFSGETSFSPFFILLILLWIIEKIRWNLTHTSIEWMNTSFAILSSVSLSRIHWICSHWNLGKRSSSIALQWQ